MKRIVVLGSTGSIGRSTLAVARALRDRFEVVGLACGTDGTALAAQAAAVKPRAVALAAGTLPGMLPAGCRAYHGPQGLLDMLEDLGADIVVNGICGAAGLLPSMAALRAGSDLALANKETVVMAGRLVLAEAAARGRRLLPVDSEHAALASILSRMRPSTVAELILTASGGAFRDVRIEDLAGVNLAAALRHPTWRMGPKITIDSATMANKGLEVIEAHRLFDVALDRIKVLIHPQSHVHSLVRTIDGTLHAEMSTPDMRIPIQNALTWPDVVTGDVPWLLPECLTFQPVDNRRYPLLGLAYAAAESDILSIVFNAANERAVHAFIAGSLAFASIPPVVEETLALRWEGPCDTVEAVLAVDADARRRTDELMKGRFQ
ncbi:MAG TPA: 1-deoxy-D-xylulose-5-phosphate reductoisomerase [Spirochaetia bacterium]